MTLSAVDADGYPDARVLILKGVAGEAFYFASGSESWNNRFPIRESGSHLIWKLSSPTGRCMP
ncbi:hypothetical protein M3650_06885 [Paenibacillus sp. MER TA 81-3]|uniref:hypothetical protein n=1 Tax=Paenibacillus sp. MER TA 81-3 TaxID=2939573 RepID=UPI00203C6F9E|nr:hypothetical protein [Paenibacillus sp. MER TA 81-3]MCM3338364.1 hypothetical protein [Paenibacillus sp. MER TA 81-3]